MKKLFVYLVTPILLCCVQACNNHSASDKSTANDSISNGSAYNDSAVQQNADSINTDTSKKNAVKIDASEVPAAVVTAFNTRYPNVADVKWVQADKKGEALYRARWQAGGKKMMAAFANNGKFIKEKQLN